MKDRIIKKGRYCCLCGLCDNFDDVELANVCSRMKPPKNKKNLLGNYENIFLVRGKFKGTYSGSIVSMLMAAKKEDLIDGVLGVVKGESIFQPRAKYARTQKEIEKLSGMRHTISSHLSILNTIPERDRIAIVGLPCHIEAIENIRKKNLLKHDVRYLLGIACGTNYDYDRFCTLLHSQKIDIKKVVYYTLRDTERLVPYFLFCLNDGQNIKVPVNKTTHCIPRGCIYCYDYLGYYADLSFGTLGAPRGYSIAFVRNERGQQLIDRAIKDKYVEVKEIRRGFASKLMANFYKMLPVPFYLPIAFKTKNAVGSELMARFKVEHLNKQLKSKLKQGDFHP